MLPPKFTINQDTCFIYIEIFAPFAKVSETEVFIEDNLFKFYSKPYYLRLVLPGNIVEDDRTTSKWHSDIGKFVFTLAKAVEGEIFEGLNLLTKLLMPPRQSSVLSPSIEILDSKNDHGPENEVEDPDVCFDWFIDQHPYSEPDPCILSPKYGFADRRQGVFTHLKDEMIGVIDLPNPDSIPIGQRSVLREDHEDDKFDESHYLADWCESEVVDGLSRWQPWWETVETVSFSESEKERMINLPKKQYIIEQRDLPTIFLGMIDILLAYCYDVRTTEGEHTVESGWTICKLSSTLSWLQKFSCLREVLCAFCRRSLIFPLYRHWRLSQTVINDVCSVLNIGQEAILRCFLSIHKILSSCDMRYILNDLYITDYCIWLQCASKQQISSLCLAIQKIEMKKDDLNLNLDQLERIADAVAKEYEQSTSDVQHSLARMTLNSDRCIDDGGSESDDVSINI